MNIKQLIDNAEQVDYSIKKNGGSTAKIWTYAFIDFNNIDYEDSFFLPCSSTTLFRLKSYQLDSRTTKLEFIEL